MRIKVMTYNIQSGRNLNQDRDIHHAIHTIRKENPDILGLNEVMHKTQLCPGGTCQAEMIAEELGYPFFQFGRSIDFMGGEYGNAVLSRFPILESEVFPIPDIPMEERDSYFEPRTHFRCTLDLGGKVIRTLNTHYGLSEGEIRSAVRETTALVQEETLPLLFMGDLNEVPDSPLLALLFSLMTDTSSAVEGSALTFPSDVPDKKSIICSIAAAFGHSGPGFRFPRTLITVLSVRSWRFEFRTVLYLL